MFVVIGNDLGGFELLKQAKNEIPVVIHFNEHVTAVSIDHDKFIYSPGLKPLVHTNNTLLLSHTFKTNIAIIIYSTLEFVYINARTEKIRKVYALTIKGRCGYPHIDMFRTSNCVSVSM